MESRRKIIKTIAGIWKGELIGQSDSNMLAYGRKIMSILIVLPSVFLFSAWCAPVAQAEPALLQSGMTAQQAAADYGVEASKAAKAASLVASNLRHVSEAERDGVRARALAQWERSLQIMIDRLETYYAAMISMRLSVEDNVMGGLGAAAERLETLQIEMAGELARQKKACEELQKIQPDAATGAEARRAVALRESMARRQALLARIAERRARIAEISGEVQRDLETISALSDAAALRIANIRAEMYMVNLIKEEDAGRRKDAERGSLDTKRI